MQAGKGETPLPAQPKPLQQHNDGHGPCSACGATPKVCRYCERPSVHYSGTEAREWLCSYGCSHLTVREIAWKREMAEALART